MTHIVNCAECGARRRFYFKRRAERWLDRHAWLCPVDA